MSCTAAHHEWAVGPSYLSRSSCILLQTINTRDLFGAGETKIAREGGVANRGTWAGGVLRGGGAGDVAAGRAASHRPPYNCNALL